MGIRAFQVKEDATARTRYIVLDPDGSTIKVELLLDTTTREFIAKISGVVADDSRRLNIRLIQPEELRNVTEGGALADCKARIRELIGNKTQWIEATGGDSDRRFYAGSSITRVQCRKHTAGTPGQLGLFTYWKTYDSVSIEKGEAHLVWYDNSKPGIFVNKNDYFTYFRAIQRVDPQRKIHDCEVIAETAVFDLTVYSNAQRTEFIARFDGSSPATLQTINPGEPYPTMKLIKEEPLRETDEEKLIEKCKERMIELGGPIENFIEHQSWETWEDKPI